MDEDDDFYQRFLRDQQEVLRRQTVGFFIGLAFFLLVLLALIVAGLMEHL